MRRLSKEACTDRATRAARVARPLWPMILWLLMPGAIDAQAGPQSGSPAQSPQQPSAPPASQAGGQPRDLSRPYGSYRPGGARPGAGQHLPQWFAQHSGQDPAQQENALRHEPGFARLPEEQQQQLINRLHRLDTVPPAQRQRMLERNERFEALRPGQQVEIREASQALREMPPERRDALRQAFRELRVLPPEQRESVLSSARYGAEYSPRERSVLANLLSIEPYHPYPPPQ